METNVIFGFVTVPADLLSKYIYKHDGPPFVLYRVPGTGVSAEAVLYYVAVKLYALKDANARKWCVWLGEYTDKIIRESYGDLIESERFYDWLTVPSPVNDGWSIRVRLPGTFGDLLDIKSKESIDRIYLQLEIDDGTVPGMPIPMKGFD